MSATRALDNLRLRLSSAVAAPVEPGRLQGLDGLRGLAMLMVIACHLGVLWIGWTGLSSFFVLSGFLITRILLGDRKNAAGLGDYFRRFYIRRTLRVFPIYYLYLALLTIAVFSVSSLAPIRGELPTAYLYLYNIHMIFPHEHTRALGHLWSLSVEEQFYLIWPWVVAFVSRENLRRLCLFLVLSGPLLRLFTADVLLPALELGGPKRLIYTYIFTLTHVDAFAWGALINFIDRRVRDRQVVAWLVLALAIGLFVNAGQLGLSGTAFGWPLFLPHGYQYLWGYSVVNAFWFLVILCILGGSGPVKRLFTLPVLDYLGKRSYSTYVVHFPLLAVMHPLWEVMRREFGQWLGTAVFAAPYLLVVFTISGLSYRYIEMPMNALKERFSSSRKAQAARESA